MTEWDMIVDNEDNNDFHLQENFHFFVVDNQGIFGAGEGIEPRFFANYDEGIFVNLAFL